MDCGKNTDKSACWKVFTEQASELAHPAWLAFLMHIITELKILTAKRWSVKKLRRNLLVHILPIALLMLIMAIAMAAVNLTF